MAAAVLLDAAGRPVSSASAGIGRRPRAEFDAGQSGRRLRAIPSATRAINAQIRSHGRTVLARSRYLAVNDAYAAAAREAFVASLVGTGIVPSPLVADPELKAALRQAFTDWTDEADADWLTDFYGMQAVAAGELFEAGECFVRFRQRRPEDGLAVPLQVQLLPAEMCPIDKNEDLGRGRRIECGIEFDAIGRRNAYHFYRVHPGSDMAFGQGWAGETFAVPADEVIHLYRPVAAGQIRGIPHTLSAMTTLAMLNLYDDAELERKRVSSLFAAFVTRAADADREPLSTDPPEAQARKPGEDGDDLEWQPGGLGYLEAGEQVNFAEPPDVGPNYEPFQLRQLYRIAQGMGVPYAEMTGDLRQANYGSIRAGMISFRRRISALQHGVLVFQFCRPVWNRWLQEAVLAGAVPIGPAAFLRDIRQYRRVKWIPPAWEWIDPEKDLRAEQVAVNNRFKPRSATIEEQGDDPEETDRRIKEDQDRLERLGVPPAPLNVPGTSSQPAPESGAASGNAPAGGETGGDGGGAPAEAEAPAAGALAAAALFLRRLIGGGR